MRDSLEGRALPALVDTYPVDVSVYGARGMGGNVQQWSADPYTKRGVGLRDGRVEPPSQEELSDPSVARRVARGGRWDGTERYARCANRWSSGASTRHAALGIRVVRSLG